MILIIIRSLGIDQGLANCGYGIVEMRVNKKGKITSTKYIECGVITTNNKKTRPRRVYYIYNKIKALIINFEPNVISCERLFFTSPRKGQRNMSASIITTNMITGLVYLLAGEFDVPMKDFVPSQVKKTVTDNGRASKDEVKDEISKILKINRDDIKNEHKADGLSVAYTGALHYKKELFDKEEE